MSFQTYQRLAASALAMSLAISTAAALTDRYLPEPGAAAQKREQFTTNCDPATPVFNVIRTQNAPFSFTNISNFSTLPGASINFETGGSRCVKVLFTAKAAVTGGHSCYVRAVVDGQVMDPNGTGNQTLITNDTSFNAHAFEWVWVVDEDVHTVAVQRRVSGGTCTIDDWTMDVDVRQF